MRREQDSDGASASTSSLDHADRVYLSFWSDVLASCVVRVEPSADGSACVWIEATAALPTTAAEMLELARGATGNSDASRR